MRLDNFTRWLSLLLIVLLPAACTHVFLQPMKPHITSPEQYGIAYEDIEFHSVDGILLHGWWFASEKPARGTVLFLHGNAENISTHAGFIYWLREYQYDVFIFDYRGYGKSAGEAEIEGAIADINAAKQYVLQRIQQEQPLYVIGHSMGASMGIYSLAKDAMGVDGAIFVSPFSEYPAIAREMVANTSLGWLLQWPAYLLVSGEYNPVDVVHQLADAPKLFLYSEDDRIIAPEHVIKLYEQAIEPKFLEQVEGYHNGVFSSPQNQQLILDYLDRWQQMPSDRSAAP